jgi:glutaredoxin
VEDRKFICPCYRHERDIAETGHCICHLYVSDDYRPVEIERPPIREEGSPWPRIVVYGAYWCRDTARTRRFLNRHGIPYILMDVDNDLQAAEKVREWNRGYLSTPALDIEGRVVIEPSDEELAELLGLASNSLTTAGW